MLNRGRLLDSTSARYSGRTPSIAPWYPEPVASADSPDRLTSLRVWLLSKLVRSDVLLGLAVLLFAVAVRLILLEPVEVGGDALNKWHFARQWFYHLDLTRMKWDHHLTRMGVNVPLFLIQAVFGRHAVVYHLAAVLASAVVAVAVYVVGLLAHGRAVGVLASIWVMLFPSWVRAGAQVSPDNFGAAWVALALAALLAYGRVEGRRTPWLILSAFCAAGAYLAKEPLVFFIPGALVGVYLLGHRFRDVALYAAVPLGVLAVETLFYRAVSPYSSRFAIVSATHGKDPALTQRYLVVEHVLDALHRFSDLPGYFYPLLVLALVGAVLLPFLTKDARVWAVICFPASFFGCYTFAFRHLSPLTLWTRFLPRYLDAGVPFAALVAALLIVVAACRLLGSVPARWPKLAGRSAALGPWALGLLLLGLAFGEYVLHPPGNAHPLVDTPRYERILTDAYQRGIPIEAHGGSSGYRALKAAYSLYIDDEALVTDGKLPRYYEAYGRDDRMVRPDAPLLPKGCVLKVWVRDRWLKMNRKSTLGPECG